MAQERGNGKWQRQRQRQQQRQRQRGKEAKRQRGKEAKRQRGKEAKRQRGKEAKEAKRQRGKEAKRQRGKEAKATQFPPTEGQIRGGKIQATDPELGHAVTHGEPNPGGQIPSATDPELGPRSHPTGGQIRGGCQNPGGAKSQLRIWNSATQSPHGEPNPGGVKSQSPALMVWRTLKRKRCLRKNRTS